MLTDLLLTGLLDGARIGVAALGFALIFYTTKELHFAYGALLTASGYLYYSLVVEQGWPVLLAAPVALAFGAAVGAVIQLYLYRRLADHLAVLLFSFGMAIILENVLHILYGPTEKVLPAGPLTRTVSLAGTPVRVIDLVTIAVFLVVWAVLWFLLERRQIGLAVRAVMRDSTMSDLVGIRTWRIKAFAYAVGSAIGAAAGLISVTRAGVRPGSGFDIMLFAFIATLLGAGRLNHVAVWSVALGLFMGLVAWPFPTELQSLFAFLAMLVYLVVRSLDLPARRAARSRSAVTVPARTEASS